MVAGDAVGGQDHARHAGGVTDGVPRGRPGWPVAALFGASGSRIGRGGVFASGETGAGCRSGIDSDGRVPVLYTEGCRGGPSTSCRVVAGSDERG